PAPVKCVDAVEAAVTRPFEEGLGFERGLFIELVQSPESKALRHAFFAERAAAKIPDVPDDTPTRPIRTAAIIGFGTMGGGIAMSFANAGIPVTVYEKEQAALDRGLAACRRNWEATAKKGRMTMDEVEKRVALLTPTLDFSALRDADIVIEAAYEDMIVKQDLFSRLDSIMKRGAILATNTSTLDVDQIAAATSRPHDVIGTHFFSPANVMRLLEVVRGAKTGSEVLATVMQLGKRLKKVAVVSGVCDGFIGNRMLEQYIRQSLFLIDEGASPQQVDAALTRFGMAMGPFTMYDMAGMDIGYAIRQRRYVEKPHITYSRIADRVVELGRLGQKTAKGWYRYEPGSRTPLPDPEIDALIATHRSEIKVRPRTIADDEIVQRCVYALVNEGAKILEEGIALRASDIDIVYLTGYGFPMRTGGPMFHAQQVGLDKVVAAMKDFAGNPQADPSFWKPAPQLIEAAKSGRWTK
ncbi:MAG: 3-hydroxyacyl-CoA dehydrogenase NAD-binding domain-containing protein, partial [Burkholderiaceae bacterium]